jgi:hypothetical protein
MRDYIAKFNGKILVTFTAYSKQLAHAAAHRYARDNVLHLDTVKAAA